MAQVFPVLVGLWLAGVSFFLREDPTTSEAPTFRAYVRAARRDYHPLQEGDTARAQAYLAVSPAVSPAVTSRG